jgi:hypothetical protein
MLNGSSQRAFFWVSHSVALCMQYGPSAVVSSGVANTVAKMRFTSEQRCSHQGNGRKCDHAVRLENLVSIDGHNRGWIDGSIPIQSINTIGHADHR